LNLLSNAIRFTLKGGILVLVTKKKNLYCDDDGEFDPNLC